MGREVLRCGIFGLVVFISIPCAGTESVKSAARLSSIPTIDGVLDDPVWAEATLFDSFVQVAPAAGAAPSRRTEVRLGHDGRTLYIAVRAHRSATGMVIAQQMKRDVDALLADDHVALVFDPDGRARNGFLFVVNANGAQRDSLIYDGGQERVDWNAIWDSAARLNAEDWTAELAIPLTALGANGTRVWGFNAERWLAGSNERLRLSGAVASKDIVSLADAARVNGIVADAAGLGLRVKPSLRLARFSADDEREQSLEPGVEIFHQTANGVRTIGAFNIDFGEAEADERIVNLTRFPLFQPEQREFFLQDAGRFSFGGLVDPPGPLPFFSRRVGLDTEGRAADLDAGIKVAGSARELDFGAFGARVARGDLASAPEVGALRVSGGLSDRSRLGMIATHGNPQGTAGSHLWGADFQYRDTQLPGGRTLDAFLWGQESTNAGLGTGRAVGGSINYPNLGFTGNAALQRIDMNFDPALGYQAEAGVTRSQGEVGWWTRTARGGDIIPSLDWDSRRTLDGAERSVLLNPEVYFANAAGDWLLCELYFERDRLASPFELLPSIVIPAGDYRWQYGKLEAETSPARPVAATATVRAGRFYDGRRDDQALELAWSLNHRWALRGAFERNDIDLPVGQFTVRTAMLRLDHAPSTRVAESLLLQWDNVSRELGASARLRWTPRPGRDVFLSINRLSNTSDRDAPVETSATVKLVWNWGR